jgi:hypothetical protein
VFPPFEPPPPLQAARRVARKVANISKGQHDGSLCVSDIHNLDVLNGNGDSRGYPAACHDR